MNISRRQISNFRQSTINLPFFTSFFLIKKRYKRCMLELEKGGRILIIASFCHFSWPVSLILNFIAQKIRGGRKCRVDNLLWLALVIMNIIIGEQSLLFMKLSHEPKIREMYACGFVCIIHHAYVQRCDFISVFQSGGSITQEGIVVLDRYITEIQHRLHSTG